jgi:alpha(1,3/1,4) fucosyltransferase
MEDKTRRTGIIKIWFSDMWPNFDFQHNYFTIYLSQYFNIEINSNPDFLIHSVYSKNHLKYTCFKVCITGENTRPNFKESDYHIGFDFNENPNYLRWPLFLMNKYVPEKLLQERDIDSIIKNKTRFCSYVVSNSYAKERTVFFNKLSEYKNVDSGGKHLNNVGGPVVDKLGFIEQSKFNIAFENSSSEGYTTEKIYEAFLSDCVPIYWGNPRIEEDFNEKAFVNVHKFKTFEEAITYIKYLDTNDVAYRKVLAASRFPENKLPEHFQISRFISFFTYLFEQSLHQKKVYSVKHKAKYIMYRFSEYYRIYKSKAAIFKNNLLKQ